MPGVLYLVLPPGSPLPYEVGTAPGIYRGDDWAHSFEFLDGEDPFVITGSVVAQIRVSRLVDETSDDPLANLDVVIDSNVVTLSLDEEATVSLPKAWVWDMQNTVGGITTTLLTGKGKTFDDVTMPN